MSDEEKGKLEESLGGYKEKIVPINKATLTWDRDLIFVGRTEQRYEVDFDANLQWGCKPTDTLLLSLAGCMAIDVVMFLQKMKGSLASFEIEMKAERNPTPPQYYTKIEMVLHIAGKNIDSRKVDRAIALSHEKYCSVYHSLRKDMEVKTTYTLEEKEPEDKK
jgi:putative redox protein